MTLTITRRQAVTAALAILFVAAAFLAGCGNKFTQPFQDAPRTGVVNSQPADIIDMPDGFNNVATKCDHGNRLYVSYHGDGPYGFLATVPHDPTCGR
jgi:hypothetical protein